MPSGTVNLHRTTSGSVSTSPNVSGTIGQGLPIGDKQIFSDTTANWNANPQTISKKDCLYVYTDYTVEGGVDIPAFKVGDGTTYLIDLPFSYAGNVTAEEKASWNNKVTAYIDPNNENRLVLSKE